MWVLHDAGWLICGIEGTIPCYWLLVHPFINRWRTARFKFKLLAPLWMLLWLIAWSLTDPWRHIVLYRAPWTWFLSALLWSVSLYMYTHAGRSFSLDRLIGKHEIQPDRHEQSIVSTGVHGLVRHPVYLGHLCTLLGWSIGTGTVATFAMTAFAILTGAIMIPLEERELRQRFGAEYNEYAARVPALLPRLW